MASRIPPDMHRPDDDFAPSPFAPPTPSDDAAAFLPPLPAATDDDATPAPRFSPRDATAATPRASRMPSLPTLPPDPAAEASTPSPRATRRPPPGERPAEDALPLVALSTRTVGWIVGIVVGLVVAIVVARAAIRQGTAFLTTARAVAPTAPRPTNATPVTPPSDVGAMTTTVGLDVARLARQALDDAQVYELRGKIAEARAAYAEATAIATDPSNALALAGQFAESQGHPADALDAYRRAVAANPKNPLALRLLADYLRRHGVRDVARRFAIRAVSADPTNTAGHSILGCIRYRDGKITEAQQWFRRTGAPLTIGAARCAAPIR